MTEFKGQQQPEQAQRGENAQPAQIQVTVIVNLQQRSLNLQFNINPDIQFINFIEGIEQQIFAQRMQAEYEEKIEYQLLNGGNITQQERRTLAQLGFVNECTLYVRLKPMGVPPSCPEHNKPISNICLWNHVCPNQFLCSECIFQKHATIPQAMMPPLERFKGQVQERIMSYGISDHSGYLKILKTLEIQANLYIQQFSYSIKRLIKVIENIDKEALRVKDNLGKIIVAKLNKNELEEMIQYMDIGKLQEKQHHELNLESTLEQVELIKQSLMNLDLFTQTLNSKFSQQQEENKIKVNIAVRIGQNNNNFQISIDQDSPFNIFIDQIKQQLFEERVQAQQEEKIIYLLSKGKSIYQYEVRTLAELRFFNECSLFVTKK